MTVYAPHQLLTSVKALLVEAVAVSPGNFVDRCATKNPTEDPKDDLVWLGDAPPVEEFVDEVHFGDLSDTHYELADKTWVVGLEFKRKDWEDNRLGGFKMRVQDIATRIVNHPNKLITLALVNGVTDKGYDDTALFSATHPIRGRQSAVGKNLLTGSGTTTAQVQADLSSGVTALHTFRDEGDEPANEGFSRYWVMYPRALDRQMREAVIAQIVASTSNVALDPSAFDLIPNDRLDAYSDKDFYIGIADAAVRGLVFQTRLGMSVEANESGDDAFNNEVFRYKARYRAVAGYGKWNRVVMIDNS